jgi:mitochondrial fission protein ELM1
VTCWGITGGSAGMAAQVKALASAIGIVPEMKNASMRAAFSWMPVKFYPGRIDKHVLAYGLTRSSERMDPPWPDLVISCGRQGAMIALGLKARIKGEANTRFIHLQDPHINPKYFDLMVTVDHDRLRGPNVLTTHYALHNVTPQALEWAATHFKRQFATYSKPHIAVLLGGSTHRYELDGNAMQSIIASLLQTLARTSGSLLITPSRRTGEENIELLRHAFSGNPRVYVYDMVKENPYMGLLALADEIIVTNDSNNMMSEAYATGKPIYILPLPGHTGSKPLRFAERMIADGIARPLGSNFDEWAYEVKDEMGPLAAEIKRRLGL